MAGTAEETNDKKNDKVDNPTGDWLGDSQARNFAVEGNDLSGYIGVDPEYMTYADDTHKPYSTDEEVYPPSEQLAFEEDDEESDDKGDTTTKAPTDKKSEEKPQAASKTTTPPKAPSPRTSSAK